MSSYDEHLISMAGGDGEPDRPVEWPEWPPPTASRSDRRACTKLGHHGMIKAGYCALCGTKVTK